MKLLTFCCLLALAVAGCHFNTGCGGLPFPSTACRFAADTIENRGKQATISDDKLDSTRSYTYYTQAVSMDSLLPALCDAGMRIDTAYYVTQYLCDDARGPLPVVVLSAPNPSMLNRGFTAGATGRLACASQLVLYTPAK